MRLETFRGPEIGPVLRQVRAALGEDAMIIHTTRRTIDGRDVVEVVAAPASEVGPLRDRLEGGAKAWADPRSGRPTSQTWVPRQRRRRDRPHVLALVGPTGAGKTTTIAKLALHAGAFGQGTVGFLALDTYRIAALEQIQTYADIIGAPLEVAYHAGEVGDALDRMGGVDTILIDAPGRSPLHRSFDQWRVALRRAQPDEVHLCLPATIRADVALAHYRAYGDCGISHLLVTKLDEMPLAGGVMDLASALDLPVRWATDGQEVPGDLRRGGASLLTAATRTCDNARTRLVG